MIVAATVGAPKIKPNTEHPAAISFARFFDVSLKPLLSANVLKTSLKMRQIADTLPKSTANHVA